MRSKFKWILTLTLAFLMQFSYAQEKTITGTVTESGQPLPGVTVLVKGTNSGTQTDFDGKYSIRASVGQTLEFSYIGMTTKTAVVGSSNTVNVVLEEDVTLLSEVVLVSEGYRKTTKPTSVSAVATVTAEEIENRPNFSFLQSLQGQVAGLNIAQVSGQPGSGRIDVFIRGVASLTGSSTPLYVIDGVPTTLSDFRGINPNDIDTFTILKDAAATAQYGNRGANGVIMITTKRGKFDQPLKFQYNGMTGVSYLPDENYNMSNARQLLTLQNRAGVGFGSTLSEAEIQAWDINTNWKDEFFRTGLTQSHDIALSSGGQNISSYVGLGYFEQEGLVPTTDFRRFSLRANINGKSSNDKFRFNTVIGLTHSKRNQLDEETNAGITANVVQNPLHGALTALPNLRPDLYRNGREVFEGIGTDFQNGRNIYVLQDILRNNNLPSFINEIRANFNLDLSYKLTDALSVNSKSGFDYLQTNRVFARAPQSYLAIVVAFTRGEEFGGFEDQTHLRDFNFTQITSLNYDKTFNDKHTINAGLFVEYLKAHQYFTSQRQNGLDPRTYAPGAGTGAIPFNPAAPNSYLPSRGASEAIAGMFSYFGLFDYDYTQRFGFSATVRRDASYRFVDDYKWGTFWNVGGRWNIDKESFMANSPFSMLKLRASYGTQGNANITGSNSIFSASQLTRDLNVFGAGYGNVPGLFVGQIANRNLRWETIEQTNIGLDFKLNNNRLEGTFDVYDRRTKDLYLSTPQSAIVGAGSAQFANVGELQNKGFEAMLRYNILKDSDLKLSVYGNTAYNKATILSLGAEDQIGTGSQVNIVGDLPFQWNYAPYLGVNSANGNMIFLDINNNVVEDIGQEDRRLTGKNRLPTFSGGFGFNADYKGFFLDAQFVYATDVWVFDNNLYWYSDPTTLANYNVVSELMNAWTPANPNSGIPSLTASNYGLDADFSDRFLTDTSYLRLRNVIFGYNFSSEVCKSLGFSNIKLFVQGENFLTWTKYRGFDPEGFNSTVLGGFPTPKTFTMGVNLNF